LVDPTQTSIYNIYLTKMVIESKRPDPLLRPW